MWSSTKIPSKGFNTLWIIAISAIIVTLWSGSITGVYGVPAKLDSAAIDSYGNPIETLKPIDTPDGRKVISAQGLQFEIPNYASGITELKTPADDLLPPFIDPISNRDDIDRVPGTEGVGADRQSNPFLSKFNTGAYNPQPRPFSKNAEKSTTTTTTTPAPAPVDENPFDSATIPPWLSSFDYPDVGPGVPFEYDPADSESSLLNDLVPPSNSDGNLADTSKPVFVTNSPISFNSFQSKTQNNMPQSISSSSSSFSTSSASSASFPSKVSLPLPSIKTQSNENAISQTAGLDNANDEPNYNNNLNANPQQQNVEPNGPKKSTSPSFNQNFPAPFEPTAPQTEVDGPKTAEEPESFPPFAGADVPIKTTFTKSDEGKVITNNVFSQGSVLQATTKPFGLNNNNNYNFNTQQKDYQAANSNQYFTTTSGFTSSSGNNINGASSFGVSSFSKTSSTPSSFSTFTSNAQHHETNFASKGVATSSSVAGVGKYTGGFGGAPGVLGNGKVGYAVQVDGSIRDPDHTQRPPVASAPSAFKPIPAPTQPPKLIVNNFSGFGNTASASATVSHKYQGHFGGPPGILQPYDNLKDGRL